MENLIEKAGSFGKYQRILLLVLGPVSTLAGIAAFVSVFNNAKPELICRDRTQSFHSNNTILTNVCEIVENITLSKQSQIESKYECYYNTEYFGVTIITEWELICKRYYLASLTQTVYMIGSASSIVVGYFSDRYGRKKVCPFHTKIILSNFVNIYYTIKC